MKARIIEKNIKDKVTDWMSTLPLELQEAISKKVVVTGGSIASMLLKEPVNDYDLYFKDIKTAMLVTRHYCKQWILDNKEASGIVKNLVPKLRLTFSDEVKLSDKENIISFFKHNESGFQSHKNKMIVHPDDEGLDALFESKKFWNKITRVEIFIQSAGMVGQNPDEEYTYFEHGEVGKAEDYIDKTLEDNADNNDKYKIVFMSSNAITLSNSVQLVIRFFGEPSKIHDTYDFIHATNYWTMKEGLVTNNKALEAILAKELIYSGSKYPLASIFRTRKFLKREWTCHVGNYVKMAMQLNDLDLCDPEVLEEQLTGVDAAYLHEIISAVKSKKKDDSNFEFNSTYICTLVDRLMGVEDKQNDQGEF